MNCRGKFESNQCRTCYNTTKGLIHLTSLTKCCGKSEQKSYAELITEVSNINVMEDSYKDLPQFICIGCSRKLKLAHEFIKQAHEVNMKLMEMLTDQEEANNCLQESQVDIQSCLEIKIEEDVVADNKTDEKYHAKLNIEESKVYFENTFDLVGLCKRKGDEEEDSIGLVTNNENDSKSTIKCIENISKEHIFKSNSVKIKYDSTFLVPSFQPEGSESDSENNKMDDKKDQDSEWEQEREHGEHEMSVINKKEEIQNLNICNKIEEIPKKPLEDEDVAVPCAQCNKIFSNSKALTRHQRTSHIPEDKKCTCPLCFRRFSRACNMYTHMRTFHGPDTVSLIRKPSKEERQFQCDKCPRNYTKKKHLNIHIKNKHNNENTIGETNKEKPPENKEITNDEIPSKRNKVKRYEVRSLCSICGSSFSSKTHLIVHMRRHTGERPFKCDLCERAYPRISELTCHRRIHTGEKPFACKMCGKTFRVSSKMTTHMRSHTDIRPYKCTQCERSFKYSKDLSIHFRIHTGERPYRCNVCRSTFTQSNTLKAHRVKLGHMDDAIENTNSFA